MGAFRYSLVRSAIVDRTTMVLAFVASITLAFMMVLVFFGALSRYLFNAPILGSNEIVQTAAVVLVMFGLPYCTAQDSHVRVDLFDVAIGKWGRSIGDFAYRIFGVVVLSFVIRANWVNMLDAFTYGDRTNLLGLPIGYFYATIVLGMTLYAFLLVVQVIDQILVVVYRNG